MRLLLQADVDGELDAAGAASVATHLAGCPACAATQAAIVALSSRLRAEAPYHRAPAALRDAMRHLAPADPKPPFVAAVRRGFWRPRSGVGLPFGMGAGCGLAVAIALLALLPRGETPDASGVSVADRVIAGHIRALQPGHLTDVVSTDQHTVKPWFDGRLDYVPPVKDLAAAGFPLIGGRLDYLMNRPVAALAYGRARHVIDLYAWPSAGAIEDAPARAGRDGYNFVHWTRDGVQLWAVSDVNTTDLDAFAKLWRAAP